MIKPLLLTILLVSAPLAAEEEKAPATCEDIAALAKSVMAARQSGLPLTRVVEIIGDNKFAFELVKEAYKRPQYPEGYRQEPITDFQNDIYLECLELRG